MSKQQNRWNQFISTLKEKKITKGIGITYQVVWNLTLIFIVFGLMAIFFVGGAGAGFFASLVKDEPLRSYEEMEADIYNYEEISEVYFTDDVFLGELPTELERREIALEDVSNYLKDAIIATEDEYFYEHDGIVPKALMRATFQELANSSVQTGGSTLTQQLVKNQILSSEVSFDRKAREIVLAMRLEQFFDKDEILEAYLNVVPFGRNASGRQIAGAQAAAIGIFGVDVKDLNLPQAAYIAGLPQSPFGYTPFRGNGEVKDNIQAGINRMNTVLNRMLEAGYIDEEQYNDALNYDIKENFATRTPSLIEEYPYLTYEVERRATDILVDQMIDEGDIDLSDLSREERLETLTSLRTDARQALRRNGYKIHTTVNKDIYEALQAAVEDPQYFGPDKEGEPEEVGSILINNQTGAILGFVGGRDFDRENLNHATQAPRPNGSTMKPLLAFAPALDIGAIQPGSIVPDTEMTYSDGTPLRNFDRRHRGLITVRESLQASRNIPAVRSFQMTPHDKLRSSLINMGIRNLQDGEPYEASSIGGLTYGTTVERNTNAFTTLANNGDFIESYLIERIETNDGEVVYEHEPEPVDVFSPQTAYLTIDMMRDVLRPGGTASSLPGRLNFQADWAGKSGTTSDFHDSWFVGTNPNVTLGVWIGYDTPKPIERTVNGLSYGARTQQIWANIANAAYSARPDVMAPDHNFERPEGIVRQSICGISGLLPSDLCREAGLVRTDLFNAAFIPNEVDDSLQRVRYVTANGERYVSSDNTPAEFTNQGVMVKDEYLENEQLLGNLRDSGGQIIPDRTLSENGQVPGTVANVRINDGQLSWQQHSDNDIVGYRIYRAPIGSDSFELLTSVKGNDTTTSGTLRRGYDYVVTAVDIEGQESSQSLTVSSGSRPDSDNDDDQENNRDDDEPSDNNEEDNEERNNDDDRDERRDNDDENQNEEDR
ncbi:transglycosylase domain-containing protein [Desertibacillus haloalkaliphilus]|uniref:transglycosylase domain-containing protein n=1 Tax=Desertibacillus haloalkaliphilus TaxID=1328930 RepID=UPI001C27713B|nr:transglycosylase domain-containing protein [Desertibacillus haloalkaliphilus]MBU8905208.1 penicillin-binding protein [Desertibacillus haloalkaliphilus]